MTYRVLVTGGRNFTDKEAVYSRLSRLYAEHEDIFVLQGGASGADRWARRWAREHGRPLATVEAQWDKYARRAGPIRNEWMLGLEPHLVVAFPGGKGTAHMVRAAKRAGVEVEE